MTTARRSLGHHTSAAGEPDHNPVTRHHPRASKLFDNDHAYAARLVQIATAVRSVVPSTMPMSAPDQVHSEVPEDDGIPAGIVTQPRALERDGP